MYNLIHVFIKVMSVIKLRDNKTQKYKVHLNINFINYLLKSLKNTVN